MRILTTKLLDELNLTVTRPGYLIQIGFSSIIRLSSIGDVYWGNYYWYPTAFNVSGISHTGNAYSEATLSINNIDNTYSALVLNEGASDIPIKVYACYSSLSETVTQVFDGVIDGADIDTKNVTFRLTPQGNNTLYSPRVFISKPKFNFLQPEGTKLVANGQTYVLKRK